MIVERRQRILRHDETPFHLRGRKNDIVYIELRREGKTMNEVMVYVNGVLCFLMPTRLLSVLQESNAVPFQLCLYIL